MNPHAEERRDDRGSALIITLMVMMLVGVLATTVAVVSIHNLGSASLAQSAGVAVDAADAGVAEGVTFLRTNGTTRVTECDASTSDDPWETGFKAYDLGSQTCVDGLDDADGRVVGGQSYAVLIALSPGVPGEEGEHYRIVSRGVGPSRAERVVSADVHVTLSGLPTSVMLGNVVSLVGGVTMSNQSIFSTGCVYKRSHIDLEGTDAFGLPAAVHAEGTISDSNGSAHDCPGVSKTIHPGACNPTYPYDQDARGGTLGATTSCVTGRPSGADWDTYYAGGSKLASGDLEEVYGIPDPPLPDEDIARLKSIARMQDNYETTTGTIVPNGDHAVLFYDLHGGTVDLSQIQGFGYEAGCPDRSLVVVIRGGGAVFHSGAPLMANIYVVSDGESYYANGGTVVGSIFADVLKMNGNAVVTDDARDCAESHPSPLTSQFRITSYQELDG